FVDPTPVAALMANTFYLRSGRNWGRLFTGTGQPTISGQNYRVGNRAYYVSPFLNTAGDGIPALMRVVQTATGGAALQPEIVISGVENLQVQYAVDTDGNGSVDQYLNGNGGVNWSQVEAVRLWVLVRADKVERGYTNNTAYQLPAGAWTPNANDGFRRVLLTKTVRLRN
ncbi:MAG: PilW family protein, partial [Gammaproteobacteria bacterium]